jgi:excisionase family DNA binding protein
MDLLVQHRLLTVGEAALVLRQSPRSVRDKIAAGEIPAMKIGPAPNAPIRIDSLEFERWLAAHHLSKGQEHDHLRP